MIHTSVFLTTQPALNDHLTWSYLVFENAPVGMLVKDINQNFLQPNKALREMLGHGIEDLARIDIATLIHQDDRSLNDELCRDLLSGKRDSYEIEMRYLHKEGHDIWCKADVSLVRDASRKPQFAIFVLEDITDRKHFEGAVKRSAGRYELIINAAGWGICEVDRDGAIAFVNAAATRMLGWCADDLIGQPVWVIHHASRENATCRQEGCPIYGALRDGLTRRSDSDIFYTKGGSGLPVEYTVMPVMEAGVANGVAITFMDISWRVEERRKMQHSMEKLSQGGTTLAGK